MKHSLRWTAGASVTNKDRNYVITLKFPAVAPDDVMLKTKQATTITRPYSEAICLILSDSRS